MRGRIVCSVTALGVAPAACTRYTDTAWSLACSCVVLGQTPPGGGLQLAPGLPQNDTNTEAAAPSDEEFVVARAEMSEELAPAP